MGNENKSHDETIIHLVDLRKMSGDQLFVYVTQTLLAEENQLYTGGNTAEHKLLFLTGGDERDVTTATTADGLPIYTNPPSHPKAPEIAEATAAISTYFEVERDMPRVLSEITDVFYNLAHLSVLDGQFSSTYRTCIKDLAGVLGFSVRDALLLAAVKYKHRLVDAKQKQPQEEDDLIRKLLEQNDGISIIPIPNDEQVGEAYRVINKIDLILLRPRLHQWKIVPPQGL